jgi:hypothetical protein
MSELGKRLAKTIGLVAVASCVWTSGAGAATQVGNECAATNLVPFASVQIAGKAGGLPIPIPEAGVITSWRINAAPFAEHEVEYLKVMRPTGIPNTFATVGESQAVLVSHPGINAFPTRIAVEAGDHLGVFGTPGTYFCVTGDPGDVRGTAEGNPPIGTRAAFTPSVSAQVALGATVEPDIDDDGYGDETQDGCPQSASLQEACPPLTLSAYGIAGRRTATILVSAGVAARVTVSAAIRLPGARRKAAASRRIELLPVTHLANPGQITTYKMSFPRNLKRVLRRLPRRRSLKLTVTAEGKNLAGIPKAIRFGVKLRSQRRR